MTELGPVQPTTNSFANDSTSLSRFFGQEDDMLSLWVAEPYIELAPDITTALTERAEAAWYGYESRPSGILETFWDWMGHRHGWPNDGLLTTISPSVGTSIGALIEQHSMVGDGIVIQPPVFTNFKPSITRANRTVVRNALVLTDDGYRMDLDGLVNAASDPSTRLMILCNPHNPVGRVWTWVELQRVAEICAANDVFVVADEVHADTALPSHTFTPFATAALGTGVSWAALHGPIKTFGVAGICDTLLITDNSDTASKFRDYSSRMRLTRNNIFGLAAFEAGYRTGGPWLDSLMALVASNMEFLTENLPEGISLVQPEGTYLAWLDFRELGLDVPKLVEGLGSVRLALSPGHWFGREGAGFARMTVAAPANTIEDAIDRLSRLRP
jgi:cystathionine beta-lyase